MIASTQPPRTPLTPTTWIVTGTDTGVGKTVVTAALVAWARSHGGSPYVVKPAQTGVAGDEPGDLATVRRLAGGVPGHEAVRLPEPLAPDTAARRAGVDLPTLEAQVAGVRSASDWHDSTLVEGSGGVRVRLGDDFDLLDLATALDEPTGRVRVIVVARAGLGTLNHTLLTVDAIRSRGLEVAGVVIGELPAETDDVAVTENLVDLPRLTGVPLLGMVPAGAGELDRESFVAAAPGWFSGLTPR